MDFAKKIHQPLHKNHLRNMLCCSQTLYVYMYIYINNNNNNNDNDNSNNNNNNHNAINNIHHVDNSDNSNKLLYRLNYRYTMWAPPGIRWFINPMNCSYKYHKP